MRGQEGTSRYQNVSNIINEWRVWEPRGKPKDCSLRYWRVQDRSEGEWAIQGWATASKGLSDWEGRTEPHEDHTMKNNPVFSPILHEPALKPHNLLLWTVMSIFHPVSYSNNLLLSMHIRLMLRFYGWIYDLMLYTLVCSTKSTKV